MLKQRLSIHPAEGTWVVRAGGAVLGESTRALELTEGDKPPVVFFPREDLGMAFLEPSETTARSLSLGEARYWTIMAKSGPIRDAGWSLEAPTPDAERLTGHIAFDTERVAVEEV